MRVICQAIPQQVRDILAPVQEHKKRVIFFRMFDHEIKSAVSGDILAVVDLYERALRNYNVIRDKFEEGKSICADIIFNTYDNHPLNS